MRRGSNRATAVMLFMAALALTCTAGRASEPATTDTSSESPRIVLVWHDAHRLYPGSYGGVAREVASLLTPLDLELSWQPVERYDPELDDRTILLRIVLMPSDPAGPGWELGEDVMGAVLPSEGHARSIYIFYKTLVRGLKIKALDGRLPDLNERKLIERALGRVVAHEMVHAVAPAVGHAHRGLMRSGVTRSFLARDDVVVATSLRRALVTGVERILAMPSSSLGLDTMPRAVRRAAGPERSTTPN